MLRGTTSKSLTKVDMGHCYRSLMDVGSEDDEMGAWAMSLNESDIWKQRRHRIRIFGGRSRPSISRFDLTTTQFHQKWHKQHMDMADECLRIGLKKSGVQQKELLLTALKYYNLAEEHCPASVSLLINRCIIYELLGQVVKAVPDAERAIELEPGNGKAVYRLARVCRLTGDLMRADMMYRQCLKLGPTIEVWEEMTEARLQYLRSEGFAAEDVHDAHILAVSLTEATLYATALKARRMASEMKYTGARIRSKNRSPLSGIVHVTIPDVDELASRFNAILIPTNIFNSKEVVLYGCASRDETSIRKSFARFGLIDVVTITNGFVRIKYYDCKEAIDAVSHMSGCLSSGLTENGNRLMVRFSVAGKRMEELLETSVRENQCLGWRTTGCRLKRCPFRHLEADYQVDLHPDMEQVTSPFQKVTEMQQEKQRVMLQTPVPAKQYGGKESYKRRIHGHVKA